MFLAREGVVLGHRGRFDPHGYNPPRSKLGSRLESSGIKV
jgi:hypothetical protein